MILLLGLTALLVLSPESSAASTAMSAAAGVTRPLSPWQVVPNVRRLAAVAGAVALIVADTSGGTTVAGDDDSMPGPALRHDDGLIAPDHLQHASLAFATGAGIGLLTREPIAAASGALAFGVAKELLDARHQGFSASDLVADAIGAALAALVIVSLER